MSQQNSLSLRVAAVGMDERMRCALQLFFQGHCNNSCALVHEGSAEISIIDLDGYKSQQLLEEHRTRYPGRPLIVLSLKNMQLDGIVCLRKPLNPQQLLAALRQMKGQMADQVTRTETPEPGSGAPEQSVQAASSSAVQIRDNPPLAGKEQRTAQSTHVAAMRLHERNSDAYIGSAPDIDPEDPKQVADAQYDPEDFFQGYLKRALSIAETENRDVRIGNQRGSIRIQRQCKTISVGMSENLMRTLSVVPVMNGAVSITRLKGNEPLLASAERHLINSDALLWKTALWASRGRVPCGTSLTEPVYLRQWPNMTRLYAFPHVLRIAALLIREPHSLMGIAKVLSIPQRNVFAFYSATHAIGLTGSAQRAVDKLFEPATVKKHGRHGLLSRLLSRLHLQ
ncbi:MAG: hypothetical protein WBN08_06955 [Thiogranum sp.]